MTHKVRKAVIPVAGFGTRFLPITKSVPKELLPLVDQPALLPVIEEAVGSGIEEIILVTARGKQAIMDFFDRSVELEQALEKSHRPELLERLRAIQTLVPKLISVRQKSALGLGHAVLTSEPAIGTEPFVVLLPDEIALPLSPHDSSLTTQLIQVFSETKLSTVAVMEVAQEEVSKYGVVATKPHSTGSLQVTDVIEKPAAKDAPSRWVLPGRYVFTASIFECLRETARGVQSEIQLSDAMAKLAKSEGLLAHPVRYRRFDIGDKLGFLKANVEFGLEHPEIGKSFRQYLLELIKGL